MAAATCGDCGTAFVWSAEAASNVCPTCGVLQDANQTVLSSQLDDDFSGGFNTQAPGYRPQSHRTLKSLRGDHGWDLAGQGKEAAVVRKRVSCLSQSHDAATVDTWTRPWYTNS